MNTTTKDLLNHIDRIEKAWNRGMLYTAQQANLLSELFEMRDAVRLEHIEELKLKSGEARTFVDPPCFSASRAKRISEGEELQARQALEIEASKQRMAVETGISRDHPKFERAWELAWDYGHSGGFTDVENYFHNLADLLK